ncbi:vascular cell adhesion protein 1-like [Aulostomus maculatus]
MSASGWTIPLLLFRLFSPATSSPVSTHTPSPAHPLQISAPPPTVLPSLPSSSLGGPPSVSNTGDSAGRATCSLMISPSTLVVRFGNPFAATCSVSGKGYSFLGWTVSLMPPEHTSDQFLVWSGVMTEWDVNPKCFAMVDTEGECHLSLPVIVYKTPDSVSISFVNHTGPMYEGQPYTLQCVVQDVAPAENLIVTFYRGQKELGRLQSNRTGKTPVNESFTMNISPAKDDDGAHYWCEAELQLQPRGLQHPPAVKSENLTAVVWFGPQLLCPTKLQVRAGESLGCEVRGNPKPNVTWLKDGQMVVPPTHSSMEHAGKYIVLAQALVGQKNLTVEVEVLPGSGHHTMYNRHFLLAVLLIPMLNLL